MQASRLRYQLTLTVMQASRLRSQALANCTPI